jgi:Immunity protein Imm1
MVEIRAAIKDQAPERIINSVEALDATLDEASSEARAVGRLNIVLLSAPNRDWLSLVVGGNETVVSFNCGHGDPPYYASVGVAYTDAPGLTAYVGLEHHTEFSRRWVVPTDAGRQAAREFLVTGERPNSLVWEEL